MIKGILFVDYFIWFLLGFIVEDSIIIKFINLGIKYSFVF